MAYPSRLVVGQLLGERFQIAALVGSGDLGEVYDGREVGTGYSYAIKTLPGALLNTQGIASFQQIAQRVTELRNESLLGVYAFDVDAAAQQPYILRELVQTPSLQKTIETSGPLQAAALAPIVTAIAASLDALHAAGIVHGNLKPSNVFPTPEGGVRLADAGQAHLRGPAGSTGLWGSPGFIPFEQTSAPPDHPSADLYAFGVLVFHALTGRLPFRSAQGQLNVAALVIELQSPLPPASHRARELGAPLGEALDAWFSRALATSPAARFPSATSLAESFRAAALMAAEPSFAAPETSGSYTKKGTLMLGNLPPDVAALVAGATPSSGAAPAGLTGLTGTMLMGTAPVASPSEVLISHKPERPISSTELATVPPGRLPAPPALAGASYEPPGGGAYGPGAGVAAASATPPGGSTPPMSGPVSTPAGVPKKSKLPLVLGLLFAFGVVVGGIVVVLFYVVGPDKPDAPEGSAPAASGSVAATPPPASETTAPPTPPAASSAAAEPTPPTPEAKDSLVTISCDPGCDAVVCDKKPVPDPAAGVRLGPGAHSCVGKKAGYAAATVTFTTTPGTDAPQTLALNKLPDPPKSDGKKPPCGTFVNPCK